MSTIVANIPSRKMFGKTYPARVDTFERDLEGRWTIVDGTRRYPISQERVIDICRRATNWAAIRSAHFPMHGFE